MRELIKKGIDAYLDLKTFKTTHPIVFIESDDWGSLRTRDKIYRDKLNTISAEVKKDPYTQLDSIATQQDLEALFEVLNSVKDVNGNPACLTPNVCAANPDFEAIEKSGFEHYFYTPFTQTLKAYSKQTDLFEIWQQGMHQKVFRPQLHGREHVHALAWLAELKAGNQNLLKAFKYEAWGIPYNAILKQRRPNLQASLDVYDIEGEKEYHINWIKDSVKIFKDNFGYQPLSFIPPAYIWHDKLHQELESCGIKTIQGIKLQDKPLIKNHNKDYKRIFHYIGERDKNTGLKFAPRNAFLEPFSNQDKDWVDITLSKVDKAISAKKPVIIGSHRINYIGRLNTVQRDKNLKSLKLILKNIVKKHPDVEFIDSGKLADMLNNN